jgi:hypothetical protein
MTQTNTAYLRDKFAVTTPDEHPAMPRRPPKPGMPKPIPPPPKPPRLLLVFCCGFMVGVKGATLAEHKCRDEPRHGTHECARHVS